MDASQLFVSLCRPDPESGKPVVQRSTFLRTLEEAGLGRTDPRLRDTIRILEDDRYTTMTEERFTEAVRPSALLVGKALSGQLVVPDFATFRAEVGNLFEAARSNDSGAVASYIPELATVDPELYAVSVCTVDGQLASYGDDNELFCVQSCCKPVLYMMALGAHGLKHTHRFMGREPSGGRFNKLELKELHGRSGADDDEEDEDRDTPLAEYSDPRAVPHNPLINSGAIMSSSMYLVHHQMQQQTTYMAAAVRESLDLWRRLTLGNISVNVSVFLSEKMTADRNKCLTFMMREAGAMPPTVPVDDALDFYFQMCSVQTTVRDMSVLAATLANGGVNPITNERVFDAIMVRHCLSVMTSCGMYDFSGEWAFKIGLPAKSGVGGCVFVVVPNVCGFAVWSPRLDSVGNSARAVDFFTALTSKFSFHALDNLKGVRTARNTIDPTERPHDTSDSAVMMMIFAASRGDVHGMQALVASGASVDCHDYDNRYPLHLAAAEGHVQAVRFLLARGASPHIADRWGHTPMDEALRGDHAAIVKLLEDALSGHTIAADETPLRSAYSDRTRSVLSP